MASVALESARTTVPPAEVPLVPLPLLSEPLRATVAAPVVAAALLLAMVAPSWTSTEMLTQARQPMQGPSGQLPVGGSPEAAVVVVRLPAAVVTLVVLVVSVVDVVTVSVVETGRLVVVEATGSDWERSQMPSPLVSTYRRHAPGYGSLVSPFGQLFQASAASGKAKPNTMPAIVSTTTATRISLVAFRVAMFPKLVITAGLVLLSTVDLGAMVRSAS